VWQMLALEKAEAELQASARSRGHPERDVTLVPASRSCRTASIADTMPPNGNVTRSATAI
jgi:hypothetical protein